MTFDEKWQLTSVIDPNRWATSQVLNDLMKDDDLLELGPGNRPRLPLEKATFVDTSERSVTKLENLGAIAHHCSLVSLPFDDASFSFVGAFNVFDYVDDDVSALRECMRVLKPNGKLMLTASMHMKHWSFWDSWEGRQRRYDPNSLWNMLTEVGFEVEQASFSRWLPLMKSKWGRLGNRIVPHIPEHWAKFEHDVVPLFPRKYRWESAVSEFSPKALQVTAICSPRFSGEST